MVQKESDVEFWADYSDTETSSDAELGDAVSVFQLDSGSQRFEGLGYLGLLVIFQSVLLCMFFDVCK